MSRERPPDGFSFSGLASPGPPAELRGRVVALARQVLADPAAPDVWTRIWESRPLRLTWAAAAALLVIANVGIGARRPPGVAVSRPNTESEREAARELAAVVALPPIDETVQPLAGRVAASASSSGREPMTRPGGLS